MDHEPTTYFVATFGCRVNQADSAGIARDLEARGLARASGPMQADVVVLNTCTVTHRSDADVRKAVARVRREAPSARVVVTGCFAQRDPSSAARIPGVAAVVGNAHRSRLPVVALEPRASDEPVVVHSSMDLHPTEALPVEPVATVLDRTRPFVKIQDGCDAHCTYCIIPSVRGSARGADPAKVEAAVAELARGGAHEVVLAGIHLGTYAHPRPDGGMETLVSLVDRLLAIPGLGRLRLSCIEPMAFPVELVDRAARDPRLAPHFHLPLQSGSDRVLKRMGRPYRAGEFEEILREVRRRLPDACLGTDVIVGFPGETDADFDATVALVERAGLDYVHVFSYSDRSGTPSTRLDGKVEAAVVKRRATALIAASGRLWTRHLDRQVGQVVRAVVLEGGAADPTRRRALTQRFCPVDVPEGLPAGSAVDVLITHREGTVLVGAIPRAAEPRP